MFMLYHPLHSRHQASPLAAPSLCTRSLCTASGACESAPFAVPRYCASYVRHSAAPNARLELWPVLRPTSCQLRQHLVLVASEDIPAGAEIRVKRRGGAAAAEFNQGGGAAPRPESPTRWRAARCPPPAPHPDAEPLVDCLARLQRDAGQRDAGPRGAAAQGGAAAHGKGAEHEASQCGAPPSSWAEELLGGSFDLGADHASQLVPAEATGPPTPWEGACGGDARMRCLVPQLAPEMAKGGPSWGIVATHLPGRSGRECRDRWLELCRSEQAFA